MLRSYVARDILLGDDIPGALFNLDICQVFEVSNLGVSHGSGHPSAFHT